MARAEMARADNLALLVSKAAGEHLKAARRDEPHPLYPRAGDVVRYVREMQSADTALAHATDSARAADLQAEVEMLERKRRAADAAIARQVSLAARRMGPRRRESIATLNAIFKLGSAPAPPLEGEYKGALVTSTLFAPLDSFARRLVRLWMPWQGKRISAESSTGDNVFTPSVRIVGRIYWPTFSGYRPLRPGLYTAFIFKTYIGPGIRDPEVSTLKLDYDNDRNPRFIVRSVLDELVQITGNYYLGKAYLKRGGEYTLAAFFDLRKEE